MRGSRRALFLAGAAILLSLSGCVYLRLLKVKNQLKDFESNFIVGGRPSWSVEFKNPALTAKDTIFLIGAPPLSVSTSPAGDVHYYEFDMVRASTAAATALEKLSLRLHMGEKSLLRRIEVPETFLLFLSRSVLEETFRQAKDAQVIQIRKTARAVIRLTPEADAELPSLERTFLLLGRPLESFEGDGLSILTYRYRITGDRSNVPIILRLGFLPSGDLVQGVITWDSSTIDVTYTRG